MIDYERLLRRYVRHVLACEGVTYLADLYEEEYRAKDISAEEREFLKRLDEEV